MIFIFFQFILNVIVDYTFKKQWSIASFSNFDVIP